MSMSTARNTGAAQLKGAWQKFCRTKVFKHVRDSHNKLAERLAQQKRRHPALAGIPMLYLYEDGGPEELQDPVRVSDLEHIKVILEALDNEHQYL